MSSKKLPTAAEILQRFYDAESIYMAAEPSERDFANGMGKHLSPKMKLYQSPDLPTGGEYDGHQGFQDWSDKMASHFDRLVVDQPEVFEKEGSDFVLMRATLRLRARKTGEKWEKPLAQVIGVDRKNEYITEIRSFYWDVRGLNMVAGTLDKEPLKLL